MLSGGCKGTTSKNCSFIMSFRLGKGGGSQSMTHYDREGGPGMTNYDVCNDKGGGGVLKTWILW